MTEQHISSPASTGGAGTFFEQHVAAYWLAQLLVRCVPPVLIETTVAEVHFQTEHLGLHTDDFLIVCGRHGAVNQKLVGQVKRSFRVSASDEECKKTIQDFWKDFKKSDPFSPANDRFVLVTQRGTNTLLEHFLGLLDCARAARDGAEFEHRLALNGFISKKAVHYCGEVCKLITDLEGCTIGVADIWSFLRLLHVLSLDLHTSTRQTEAQIKNLLAHMVTEGDASDVATKTWNALLVFASTMMSEARSMSRADLPEELQQHHVSFGSKEQRILSALKGHTIPVLRRIRSTIGQDFHLQRAALVQKVLEGLDNAQVVLVSGPAGSGKSVIGKDAVSLLSQEHFVFGFRVEEFAKAHIDETLLAAQVPTNAEALTAILATQGRKVILVESVERLLEKTTRDAFSDLLGMVASDSSMCIIITCRNYSSDLVCASFLKPAALNHAVVNVPPLEDAELEEIEAALPELSYPLNNSALRDILRNPYFLDKALEISWSTERPVPESEREFRLLFWKQIVCASQDVPSGMSRRREEVFQEIAIRRARALSAFVICTDLDPAVVDALRKDSLVVSSDENQSLIATAHDVLEDWAILQWLEEKHLIDEGSFKDLSAAIGAYPAIRRSYRKWVAELIERNPDAADRLFRAAVFETDISSQFRDDTLVSLLKAPMSSGFLARHEVQLLANDRVILKRIIHLLRVACVTIPTWLAGRIGHGSILNVPDGPAWTTVLKLVHQNIDSFAPQERQLLLGLIEDAVRNVSWWAPELEGAEYVAGIGHWLLASFGNRRAREPRKRVLKVLTKIPMADADCFEFILRGQVEDGQRLDYIAEDLREILFFGLEGMAAARDLPDLVISVAVDYLLVSEEEIRRNRRYSIDPLDLEENFGIKKGLRYDFYPASALRGPWIFLLKYHPQKALDFFIKIFNHSADWYAHPRIPHRLEPPWEIELTFADGSSRKQWGNPRLWNLYRGISTGPTVLECLLMALEKWLLELASKHPEELDTILVDILRRSESAALAGVVASIATAYPHASGEALLVLLSAPDYIKFDRSRIAVDSQASAMSGMYSRLQPENHIYVKERQDSCSLPHRGQDLEAAIINLQLGSLASRVQAILDRHLAALPPKSEQNQSDLMWRLAIHRMDFRQYIVTETTQQEALEDEEKSDASEKVYVQFQPTAPDSDVQAMVDEGMVEFNAMSARLGLMMWGIQIFERKSGNYDSSLWRDKLAEAQRIDRDIEYDDGSGSGPGFVASVCARDHWEEISSDEQDWCVNVVCSEILRKSDQWSRSDSMQRNSMAADRPCASVVSLLLNKQLREEQMLPVQEAFVAALTHPIDEVRWYATWGIDEQFWDVNQTIALRCVNAIAMETMLIHQKRKEEEKKPYDQQLPFAEIIAKAANTVRQGFWQEGVISEDAYREVDISDGLVAKRISRMLAILGQVPEDPITTSVFMRVSHSLVDWWNDDDNTGRGERHFEAESELLHLLQRFVMRASAASSFQVLQPLLSVIENHPREVFTIVQGLTEIEDSRPNTAHYWYIWNLFADGIRRANWVAQLQDKDSIGSEMLSVIFLTVGWKDSTRHWKSIEGYSDKIHSLFETLPPVPIVFDNYLRFLYHIGEQSLPEAFVRVANSLRQGDSQAMLNEANTVFLLEVLLQRHVYGRPLELKSNVEIRQAVLFLLDILVENGSSAAYRMRDDFVTPAA